MTWHESALKTVETTKTVKLAISYALSRRQRNLTCMSKKLLLQVQGNSRQIEENKTCAATGLP